jgi:hypothetical protein
MPAKPPVCLAFILCERVTHDPLTGKHTLVGLLDDYRTLRVPCVCPSLVVYAELTGSQGRLELVVRIVRLLQGSAAGSEPTSAAPISTWSCGAATLQNPDAVAKIDICLEELRLPAHGDYLFILVVNGTPVAARRFTVALVRTRP